MLKILRSDASPSFQQGPFKIRRIRPGSVLGAGADPAFGPLSVIDHANLSVGTIVRMHEHRNDEILSYMWRGTMVHEDSAGHRVAISPQKLMMMNAGSSFWHEESTPRESVEMLQIFIRPQGGDLPPHIDFWDREQVPKTHKWQLVAGPKGSGAPLVIRQRVVVFDCVATEGDELTPVPVLPGMAQWLYVMDGAVIAGAELLHKGDAIADTDAALPPLRVSRNTTLLAFLVDLDAAASRAGTISGQ